MGEAFNASGMELRSNLVHEKLATASIEVVQEEICGVKNSVFGVYVHDDRLKNKAYGYAVPKRWCDRSFTWWSIMFECAGDTNDVFVTKRAQTLGDQFCFRPQHISLVVMWAFGIHVASVAYVSKYIDRPGTVATS